MSVQAILSSLRKIFSIKGKEHLALFAALILAIVNGIVYMAVIPPWQHYDEPYHFEFAWLIANRPGLPKLGDYDLEMRKMVASSMIQHNFFKNMGFLPDLNSTDKPAYIGPVSQLGDPPLYYLVASMPLRLFKLSNPYLNIDWQYRSVQIISLLFFLATVYFAWGLVRELAGAGSPLVWIVPVCLALEPSFNSTMTSINDDVGAIAAFTFFLWGSVFLIQRGFSWKGLAWTTTAAVICLFTKSNVYVAVPLLVLVVLLSVFPLPRRWLVWTFLGLAGFASLFVVFSWGDASDWYRTTFQSMSTRVQSDSAQLGNYVFQLSTQGNENNIYGSSLHQIVAYTTRTDLSGQPVTLGAWIWANKPATIRSPMILTYAATNPVYQNIQITQKPAFFSFTTVLPAYTALLQVILYPFDKTSNSDVIIYYDGLVLLKGQWPADQTPQFTDPQGASGSWGGVQFTNLLLDGSAETAWPQIRSWVDRMGSRILPDKGHPSVILYAILHWKDLAFYYTTQIINLIRTFWAKFGWGKVSFLGGTPYRYLSYLMGVGLIGAILGSWRYRKKISWNALIFLSIAGLALWLTAFLMGTIYIFSRYYYPPARYAFPVIVPTLLLLVGGWLSLAPTRFRNYIEVVIPIGFFLINIYALISIYLFYLRE